MTDGEIVPAHAAMLAARCLRCSDAAGAGAGAGGGDVVGGVRVVKLGAG